MPAGTNKHKLVFRILDIVVIDVSFGAFCFVVGVGVCNKDCQRHPSGDQARGQQATQEPADGVCVCVCVRSCRYCCPIFLLFVFSYGLRVRGTL